MNSETSSVKNHVSFSLAARLGWLVLWWGILVWKFGGCWAWSAVCFASKIAAGWNIALLWSYEKGFPCLSVVTIIRCQLCPSWEEHPKSPWTLRKDPTEWSTALRSNGSLPLIGAVRLPCPQRQSGECKGKTRGGKVGQTKKPCEQVSKDSDMDAERMTNSLLTTPFQWW